jgi:hypothetical protein
MTARKLRWTVAGLAVVAAGAFALWPRAERVTRENFARVKYRMTRAEVEAILGSPTHQYAGRGRLTIHDSDDFKQPPPAFTLEWDNDRDTIAISFDESGREVSCVFSTFPVNRPPLETLRWRLHRLWPRWFPAKEYDD